MLIDESAVHGSVAYQIKNGELRPRRSSRGLSPDELAQEVLYQLPKDERTADVLLQRVLDRYRRMQTYK